MINYRLPIENVFKKKKILLNCLLENCIMFIGAFNVWALNFISIGECRLTHLIPFVTKNYVVEFVGSKKSC